MGNRNRQENRLIIPAYVALNAVRQEAQATERGRVIKYINRTGATFYRTTGKLWKCLGQIHAIALCNGGEQTEDAMRHVAGQLIAALDELNKILNAPALVGSPAYLEINPETLTGIRDYCKLIRELVTNYLEATHNTKAARRQELIEYVRLHDDEIAGLYEAFQTAKRQGRTADPGTELLKQWYEKHRDECSRMSWAECEALILDGLGRIGPDFRNEAQEDAYQKLLPMNDNRLPGDRLQKIVN